MQHTEDNMLFDVVIIGGSYAGLSAAMALGRSLRSVLIIDEGQPCNRQTPHSHNFLTQDGATPQAIAALAKEQVQAYPSISWLAERAVSASQEGPNFRIQATNGRVVHAKKVILATGIKDNLPDIDGFADCWGITVIHCPYCHGYEFRRAETAILAHGERAMHLASLVHNLTDKLTIINSSDTKFDEVQRAKLSEHHINLIEDSLTSIIQQDGHIQELLFSNGSKLAVTALYAAVPFSQSSDLHQQLGCQENENGYIKVDSFQKTNIPGVYACGDNSFAMRSVANAVYSGNLTGAMVNKELVDERF